MWSWRSLNSSVSLILAFDIMASSSLLHASASWVLCYKLIRTHRTHVSAGRLGNPTIKAQGCKGIQTPPSPRRSSFNSIMGPEKWPGTFGGCSEFSDRHVFTIHSVNDEGRQREVFGHGFMSKSTMLGMVWWPHFERGWCRVPRSLSPSQKSCGFDP